MRVWETPFTPAHEAEINKVLMAYRESILDDFLIIFNEIEGKLTLQ